MGHGREGEIYKNYLEVLRIIGCINSAQCIIILILGG